MWRATTVIALVIACGCSAGCGSSASPTPPSATIKPLAGTYRYAVTPSATCDLQEASSLILGFSPVSLTQSGSAVTIAFNITLATLDLSGNVSGAVLTLTMRAWDTYSVTYHLASGSGSAVIQNDMISGEFDGTSRITRAAEQLPATRQITIFS